MVLINILLYYYVKSITIFVRFKKHKNIEQFKKHKVSLAMKKKDEEEKKKSDDNANQIKLASSKGIYINDDEIYYKVFELLTCPPDEPLKRFYKVRLHITYINN